MESQWRAHRQESHLDEGVASLRKKETEPEATDELKERLSLPEKLRVSPLEFINQRSTNEFILLKGKHGKSHPTGIN